MDIYLTETKVTRVTKVLKDFFLSLRLYSITLLVILGVCHERKLSIQHNRYKSVLRKRIRDGYVEKSSMCHMWKEGKSKDR